MYAYQLLDDELTLWGNQKGFLSITSFILEGIKTQQYKRIEIQKNKTEQPTIDSKGEDHNSINK